ncbi:MAG: Penicillin-binding protein 2 [Candidatus Magasanikbacteria bacterium GW2011_GWA2_56_11]|uniref:Penicillin-binding protein 2 n=1 Tax=Candidatus Magasanikbacteria bacterium GW2011_GWA2_56_11 TaxID=1619044 RepID=A0A0G2AMG7_9BACT|nr:MAG: Penicillin-binding protein 2 [Candidatus Magasanikbacteria bacterium GW2011_GWA2_56_11]
MNDVDPVEIFPLGANRKKSWRKITGAYKTRWVEGTLPAGQSAPADRLIARGTSHIGTSFSSRRARLMFAVMLGGCLILLGRLLAVQLVFGQKYRELAENNSERIVPVPAERGLIYDRRGRLLTKNVPNFSVLITPRDLPRGLDERALVLRRLAELAEETPERIDKLLREYSRYKSASVIVREDIDYETALRIYIASADLPGVQIERGSKRLYVRYRPDPSSPYQLLADETSSSSPHALAAVLGYLGKLDPDELETLYGSGYLPSDSIGKTGIEKTYEFALRGVYGRRRIEVNALGREQTVLAEYAPQPGAHLELSLDVLMQASLEQIMRRVMKSSGTERGAGVVLEPKTGRILALVSIPAYDNNDFSGGIGQEAYGAYLADPDRPLFNRAVSGVYPSGSTIKPVIAAAALAEKIITPQTTVASTGGIRVGQWFFPDWQPSGHGQTNVARSIAWSVNTFYYYIGGGYAGFRGLGVEKIADYLRIFGFGTKLGVDLTGEEPGFVPSKEWKEQTKGEPWYIGDTYNLSIGQGDLLVTPLQIAAATAAIANGGTLYQPQVGNATSTPDGSVRTELPPRVIKDQVAPREYVTVVRQGMRDCVVYGSCRQLSSLPLAAAGKTGTAQWNADRPNHAWFTSFAPYDNPEIAVTVIIEEGVEGSRVAVPVVHEFLRWWAGYRK